MKSKNPEEFALRMRSLKERGLITVSEWYTEIIHEMFVAQRIRRSELRPHMTIAEWTELSALATMDGFGEGMFPPRHTMDKKEARIQAGVGLLEAHLNNWEVLQVCAIDGDWHTHAVGEMPESGIVRIVVALQGNRFWDAVAEKSGIVNNCYIQDL